MPPQSRGQLLSNLQSKSTPNLSTLNSLAEDSTLSPTSSIASAARHNHASSLATPKAHDSTTEQNDPSLLEDAFIEGITPETLSNDSASSSDDDDEDLPIPNLPPQRPLYTHHSRSHSHLLDKPSAPFAPPFYNRPPTPLPPSPSLTSLLRPAFTSRPTTPDSSDHEGPSTSSTHLPRNPHPPGTSGTATPASSTTTTTAGAGVASSSTAATFVSLAPTHGVPRAHPPVPTYEYYGFVLYLCSSAAFIGYLLWAYLPSALLHQLGIRYYPNRWWALALPAWGVVALVFVYVVLACWNTEVLTLKVESVEGMVDEAAMVAVVDEQGRI
ncbi:PIG-P-domain-containing protein, partial [Viridothelium virens]